MVVSTEEKKHMAFLCLLMSGTAVDPKAWQMKPIPYNPHHLLSSKTSYPLADTGTEHDTDTDLFYEAFILEQS